MQSEGPSSRLPFLIAALVTLRRQIDELAPTRDRTYDSWIADTRHSLPDHISDHLPDKWGCVRALDITHDPENGVDTYAIALAIARSRDPRVRYIISNGKLFVPHVTGAYKRAYNGRDPHKTHMHISVKPENRTYTSNRPWTIK